MTKKKLIGILGGTFDPIHLGHIYLAEQSYQHLKLQEIRFIPAYQPVHRDTPGASVADRLAMVKLAIADHSNFILDEREIIRQGPSYMIDTLISLHQEMPDNILCLLMATDAFAGFNKWHRWQEILNYAHIVIADRPELPCQLNPILQQYVQRHQIINPDLLKEKTHGSIYFMTISHLPISATEIRQQIAAGKNAAGFLPATVWDYIQKKNLYR